MVFSLLCSECVLIEVDPDPQCVSGLSLVGVSGIRRRRGLHDVRLSCRGLDRPDEILLGLSENKLVQNLFFQSPELPKESSFSSPVSVSDSIEKSPEE